MVSGNQFIWSEYICEAMLSAVEDDMSAIAETSSYTSDFFLN